MTQVGIKATITRWADDHFPGYVEVEFTDRFGQVWTFVVKVPVVSLEHPGPDSAYPRSTSLEARFVSEAVDAEARRFVTVETLWVEAEDGNSRFELWPDQVMPVSD